MDALAISVTQCFFYSAMSVAPPDSFITTAQRGEEQKYIYIYIYIYINVLMDMQYVFFH
jgi:hypothetical protein